jgi:uncharacterized protein (DUF1778 family)
MSVVERSERERVAIAIYEARVHAAIINGWDAEPAALRERFLKAADAALNSSGAVFLTDEQWERVLSWLHVPVPPGPAKVLDESIIRAINAQRGR